MNKQTWPSVLWDLAVILILAFITIHYANKLNVAKEEIEVIRLGFQTLMCLIALVGTLVIHRMYDIICK